MTGVADRTWMSEGICRQELNPELHDLFFAPSPIERRPARNLCYSCPVREQCLRWALENQQIWGVWGGCDEAELRRALWVDVNGIATKRCRFPHCPMCKARPSNLHVVGVCELPSGRRRERVECETCGFSWRSPLSVAAVKAYWKDRKRRARIRTVATRARIPSERRRGTVVPIHPSQAPDSLTVLVASGVYPS